MQDFRLRHESASEVFHVPTTGFGEESSQVPAQVSFGYLCPSRFICLWEVQSKALILPESREMWGSSHVPNAFGGQEKSLGIARQRGTL